MKHGVPLYHVDAFADRPFTGNPAAVCVLDAPADPVWMQQVAAEMNLSETAFIHPQPDGWRLRWFTPAVEVKLCGHATLATAHVLWESGRLSRADAAAFDTASGLLLARCVAEGIEMQFPARPAAPATAPRGLAGALGIQPVSVGRSEYDFLIEVDSAEVVRSLRPDFARLAALPVRGIIVTSRADDPAYDFISRFFAPAAGVNEDPVTGSAHCTLGPFWAARLGKTDFNAWQASARGGRLRVVVQDDHVVLGGTAITTARGTLLANP